MVDRNLRVRLELEAPVHTPDGAGGQALSYQPVAQIWCSVTPARTRLVDGAGGSVAHSIVHIVTRAAAPSAAHRPRAGYRLKNLERSYIVEKVEEISGMPGYLELTSYAEVTQ